jgi:hypothetical protein
MIVRQVGAGDRDVVMFLHTSRSPSRAEWDEFMALLARAAIKGDLQRLRGLIVSDGGGPDATMRGHLQEFFKKQNHALRCAVMMTNVISRGIVAAVSLFNPNLKPFSPRHFPDALAYLGLPRTTEPRLLREFTEMERELGPNSCLSLITSASASASP